jgi:hypothetical protein
VVFLPPSFSSGTPFLTSASPLLPRRTASGKSRHTKVFLCVDNINGKFREESPGGLGAVTTFTGGKIDVKDQDVNIPMNYPFAPR